MMFMLYQHNQQGYGADRIRFYIRTKGGALFLLLTLLLLPGLAATSLAQTIWTGSVSSDWNTTANWSTTAVPGSGDNVVIPSGTTNAPVLSTTNVARTVEVQSGASFTISSTGSLSVTGRKNVVYNSTGYFTSFFNGGTVVNLGELIVNGPFGYAGMINVSSFSNLTGSRISIDCELLYLPQTGLLNLSGSFNNTGTIRIGSTNLDAPNGLENRSVFSNQGAGNITIDRVIDIGVYNNSGTFVNEATITIAGLTPNTGLPQTGLSNSGSFSNAAGGNIRIDQANISALFNQSGNFINSATIAIGSSPNARLNGTGLSNTASLHNVAGGNITIDRTAGRALYTQSGSFINSATITLGASVTGVAVTNGGAFDNQGCTALLISRSNGNITNTASFSNTGAIIENSSGNSSITYNGGLIQNLNGGSFTVASGNPPITSTGLIWRGCVSSDWNTAANWLTGAVPTAADDVVIPSGAANNPVLSTTAVARTVEVQSGASFTISSAGRLTSSGDKIVTSNGAQYNVTFFNGGTVVNLGAMVIGNTASFAGAGLWNIASFSNVAGASLTINLNSNFISAGIVNQQGSFVNSAAISIGSTAAGGQSGISNFAVFSNLAGGSIAIDRTSFYGIYNLSGSFVNQAAIRIGTIAGAGTTGLFNRTSFRNLAGGSLTIDRTETYGIDNNEGNMLNEASISIRENAAGTAISNSVSSIYNNQGCSALLISSGNAVISNSASFSNTGTIIESSTGTSGISYNGGLIQNLNGGSFTVTSGTPAITTAGLIWRGCVSSDWNTAANWSTGAIPMAADDVVIPAGTTNSPLLSTTAVANSVEVQSGASLTISSSGSLSINGSKSISGYTRGFSNSGQVRNGGRLVLGNTGSVGFYGLYNESSFTNTAGGIIQIDRADNTGLYNEANSSFVNSATIVIGSVASAGANGLFNAASFTNTAAGNIQIDRTSAYGVNNSIIGGSFVNSATIVIGSLANVRSFGLYNEASFSNLTGGNIQIDRTSGTALYNKAGTFVNQAAITIGASAEINAIINLSDFDNQGCTALLVSLSNGNIINIASFSNTGTIIERSSSDMNISYNGGLIQNLNGGSFTVTSGTPAITTAGLIWRGCVSSDWNTAANWSTGAIPTAADDVIIPSGTANAPVLSTTAVAKSVEVQSGASLTISSAGSLSVSGNKKSMFNGATIILTFSNDGTIVNEGRLLAGDEATGGGFVLLNKSSFQNLSGGVITLDRSDLNGYALYNAGNFINEATIRMGSVGTAGTYGLLNNGSFRNVASGNISINNARDQALFNVSNNNSTFINSATITIASSIVGLQNEAFFSNLTGGLITINRTSLFGMRNLSGFTNAATINIGTTGETGMYGISNEISSTATFSNANGGKITIDRAETGLYNSQGQFVNAATISIGNSVTGTAIRNRGAFDNQGCTALLTSLGNGNITNTGSFSNTGTIIESATGTSGISYNGGLIQNLNGGSFTVASGNPPLSVSATDLTTCNPVNGSFTLTGVQPNTAYTLSYTLGNATASLSQTGNAAGQLTAANLSAGAYALALSGSCVAQTLPLSATLNPPAAFTITTQPPATSVVCAGSSISAAVGVSGTTGPVTYQWYKNSLASPVASQTAATLLLSGLTAAESGSYSVVITDNCTSATSAAFSLTVNPLPSVTVTAAPSATLTCTNPALTLTAQTTATAFAWSSNNATSQTLSVSQSGVYSVTVTDGNGCTAVSNSLTITQDNTSPTVSLSATGSVLTCTQPQITLTATASTTALRWSTGQTTLTLPVSQSGVYSVTATGANGCTAVSNSLTITQDNTSPTVSISATGNQLTCPQPTLTLTATASVTALRWSTGQTTATISVTAAGTYSVTATGANGCSAVSNNLLVSENFSLPPFTVSSATVCPGQPVSLTALGCGGQMRWSNGMSGSVMTVTAGSSTSTLTATCTVGICTTTAAGQIVIGGVLPPPAQILSFTSDETACPVKLTGKGIATSFTMTGPKGYVFSTVFREGGTREAIGLNVQQAGVYTLTATYTNSCGTSAPVSRTVTVGRSCP